MLKLQVLIGKSPVFTLLKAYLQTHLSGTFFISKVYLLILFPRLFR